MNDIQLTKDSDALICILYKKYKQDIKNGSPKADARVFGSSKEIYENLTPKWSYDDVDDTCSSLHRAELVSCWYADDVAYRVELTDKGIIYMENRFKNGIDGVIDHIGKLKGLVPFI
ncbi:MULTISPECIES: hypothetical protein [Bacillus]|uniref:hypothetical protein n=1 Tax=Bacillus TaxID=1386 RepID=UPI000D02A709|nr:MULTISPECIES: hypothetical protein [Bacillus]PRS28772.1 hypothetical protein C6X99_14030 [Bacillus pumilus]PRS56107.1 hypothetical protein C6Y06_03845 [Bacillus sp. MZGC1]PRS63509.1 hypothetical protein C6X97_07225 [Bacillus pumilus]PRS68414.1 hypothetical protein C6X98_02585 [Bacillus pumilus]